MIRGKYYVVIRDKITGDRREESVKAVSFTTAEYYAQDECNITADEEIVEIKKEYWEHDA